MKVHRDIQALPEFKKAVVTIGTFDGVHLGHQQIIRQLKKEATRIHGETIIITFDPHPRKIVAVQKPAIHLLNTLEEKTSLLEKHGIELPSFQIDWCLWDMGQRMPLLKPYHRTRTIYY